METNESWPAHAAFRHLHRPLLPDERLPSMPSLFEQLRVLSTKPADEMEEEITFDLD